MLNKNILLPACLFLFATSVWAQKLRVDVGLNLGASQLYPNINFKSTPLNDLYEFVKIPFDNRGIPYAWEDFEQDYKLKQHITQPRYGLSAHVLYGDWPLFVNVEALSSTSGYQKLSYGLTGGLRYALQDADDVYSVAFMGGYKFVVDQGFGDETLVNSFGEGRDEARNFFRDDPVSLGRNRGSLATLRLEALRALNESKTVQVGVHLYGEWDLTGRGNRLAGGRMNSVGGHVFARFMVFGKVERWRPEPAATAPQPPKIQVNRKPDGSK